MNKKLITWLLAVTLLGLLGLQLYSLHEDRQVEIEKDKKMIRCVDLQIKTTAEVAHIISFGLDVCGKFKIIQDIKLENLDEVLEELSKRNGCMELLNSLTEEARKTRDIFLKKEGCELE